MLEGLRRRVIEVLEIEAKSMKTGELLAAVGCNRNYGQDLLKQMLREDLVTR